MSIKVGSRALESEEIFAITKSKFGHRKNLNKTVLKCLVKF